MMTEVYTFYEERNCRLASTDYVTKIATEYQVMSKLIPQKYIDLIEYRQKLRDLPEREGFDANDSSTYEWPMLL